MFLKEYQDKATGFADLLNYAAYVEEGIIQGKDGSLMAGWYFRGSDTESSSNEELEAISARLNASLLKFDSGWMLQVDCIRKPAIGYPDPTSSFFCDRTSLLIDYERQLQYMAQDRNFECLYAITLTYTPPLEAKGKLIDILYSSDENTRNMETGDRILGWYKKLIREFELSLSVVFNNSITRMKKTSANRDGFLEFICASVNGDFQPINLPSLPMYLDNLIGSQDFIGGNAPKLGEKHINIISIEGFPMESYPSILDNLNHLPVEYRWNSRFIFLGSEEAKSLIDKQRKKWKQKIRGFKDQLMNTGSGAVDMDAALMANDAEAAMSENSSGLVRYGDYTSVIVLSHVDKEILEGSASLIVKTIKTLGFIPRVESVNAVEAYLGSLPGHGYHNIRKSIINSLNLADLLPTTSIWPGLEHNPCPFYAKNSPPLFYAATTGYSPFRVSLHVGDVGHTLILGPTGSGKSTLLSFIMAQSFRYKNAQVFCFDKGYSAYILANASSGEHFDIAGDKSNLAFCPLANIDLPLERFWAEDWIETLLELQNVKITPGSRQKIHHAMGLLASSDSRTMTDFINTIQDADLREALTPYSLAGSMGRLLDARTDSLTDRKNKGNRFQIFEMEHLMALGERNIVPVLTYLFHRIDNQLDGSPSLIVLDESWLFISHPIFRDKIREWLKTLRKNNTAVIFATQSITDIANSPIRDVVYESCPTKILLPNPEAGNEVCKQEYSKIGLNDQQIELIKSAIPKRHYYYLSTYGKRLFELGLGDVAKAFTASSSKEDIKLAKNLIDTYGQTWPAEWLKSKNLDDFAKAWMEFK